MTIYIPYLTYLIYLIYNNNELNALQGRKGGRKRGKEASKQASRVSDRYSHHIPSQFMLFQSFESKVCILNPFIQSS